MQTSENKQKKKKIYRGISFLPLFGSALVLALMIVVLTAYQINVVYETGASSFTYLDASPEEIVQTPDTLFVWEPGDEGSEKGAELMNEVLSQMKEPYQCCEASQFSAEDLQSYEKIVIGVTDCGLLADSVTELKDWVSRGGDLMFLYMPNYDGVFMSMSDLLGIKDCAGTFAVVDSLHFVRDLMPGGMAKDFGIEDAYDSSLSVSLLDSCSVYLQSASEYPVPVIWTNMYGQGQVVADNLGFLEKAYRGFHCAAYSLLSDACIYPVINGSSFFIDDFPSPVPDGNGKYISRDYGLNISDFYTQVWWADTYNLAKKYGIKYTGLVIEQYSDQVSGTFPRNTDTERYSYFGNMLLQAGGEIGIHGYNHMPLVLENFDYQGMYDSYMQWKSEADMKAAFTEVTDFTQELYPDNVPRTYVPPSNILSDEGRAMIAGQFPQIRSIASVYFPGELAFAQEFDVSEDGIVNTPRIISGYLLGNFEQNAALSELTFHYVNTHFQHPDDVLDEDRGAEKGWKVLFGNLENYTAWLYEDAAPSIRNLTGSELGAAVQRYDYVEVERTKTDEGMQVHLDNFYDEASLLLRINCTDDMPSVQGGTVEKVSEGLYLVTAQQADLTIIY